MSEGKCENLGNVVVSVGSCQTPEPATSNYALVRGLRRILQSRVQACDETAALSCPMNGHQVTLIAPIFVAGVRDTLELLAPQHQSPRSTL